MKRKTKCKCKKKVNRMRTYMNGGVGQGLKAVVHKGEVILRNPFRRP